MFYILLHFNIFHTYIYPYKDQYMLVVGFAYILSRIDLMRGRPVFDEPTSSVNNSLE